MTRYLKAELLIAGASLMLGVVGVALDLRELEMLAVLTGCSAFTLVLARALL